MSTQAVADMIAADLGLDSMSGETVRLWEHFTRHPPIDRFAAWARVLDYRLIVSLVHQDRGPTVMLTLAPKVAEVAAALDLATAPQLDLVRSMLVQLGLLDPLQ